MTSVSLCRVLCAGLALAVVGAWGAPPPAGAQAGTVPATIAGTVTKRADNSALPNKTVKATCFYNLSPAQDFFSSLPTDSNGNYSISVLADVAGSNCIVKVISCPGSNPIQRTVRVPPDASGVNFGCSS